MTGFARFLSLGVGFLSLSQEILWIRFSGFAYHGAPQAFSFVLAMYLFGIAVGAAIGKRYCREGVDQPTAAGRILLIAGFLDLILPWGSVAGFAAGKVAGVLLLSVSLIVTSLLKSMVFPIAHHLGSVSQASKVGSSVSKVYVSNILGSTLGPILTGFVLLQAFSLQQNFFVMGALTLGLGVLCISRAGRLPRIASAVAIAGGALLLLLPNELLPALIKSTMSKDPRYRGEIGALVENRYGIIHTLKRGMGEEIIFGGNSYDGTSNVDLVYDANGISRAYLLGALHPASQKVLIIGLSGGAWAQVVSDFPGIQRVDIVEINPGYVDLVKRYPATAPLLSDPRVRIYADDGRRWLNRHPDEKYDLILMNTTQHWRAYASLLLSQEFHALVKRHLNSGGLFAYNATESWDAFRTAMTEFKYVYVYWSLVIAADYNLVSERPYIVKRISAMPLVKQSIANSESGVAAKLELMTNQLQRFDPRQTPAKRDLEIITDQNMLSEYKYGYPIFHFFAKSTSGPQEPR